MRKNPDPGAWLDPDTYSIKESDPYPDKCLSKIDFSCNIYWP